MLKKLRYGCNVVLCALGAIGYVVFLGWTVIGVWPIVFQTLHTIMIMMTTGYPAPGKDLAYGTAMALLAWYFSMTSPMIISLYRRAPLLRPILVVGCVFLLGLTLTHAALFHLLNAGVHSVILATAVGTTGIVLTRLFMSWLFEKVPVAALAKF